MNVKEKAIAHIASAITVFSMQQNTNQLPKNISMIDFILKTVPENIKQDVTMELIDSVFLYVSATRFDT
ncbi:hypothetical protein HX833_00065 [Marine Group I thaumarchaeote]|uniref:Uncharacterized protein n=1 Tax=Marine Group I thaumarchaeote TaxID=2511932 RepID=A0A7K4NQ67_9ARCH|nr:hypothetical protein [Marine Group I thaumarchaeote]